jgi:hypothetical protein
MFHDRRASGSSIGQVQRCASDIRNVQLLVVSTLSQVTLEAVQSKTKKNQVVFKADFLNVWKYLVASSEHVNMLGLLELETSLHSFGIMVWFFYMMFPLSGLWFA